MSLKLLTVYFGVPSGSHSRIVVSADAVATTFRPRTATSFTQSVCPLKVDTTVKAVESAADFHLHTKQGSMARGTSVTWCI